MTSEMQCDLHEASPPTVVCRHLFESGRDDPVGFITGFEPDVDRPLAWCRSCEAEREAAGRWTESAEAAAGWTAICSHCYEEIRSVQLPLPAQNR